MYTLTRGPVPDKVAFTIRVDSSDHPELATFLHNLPYGARSAVVAELLALGLAAKQAGATLTAGPRTPASPAAPTVRRRPRKPAIQPVLPTPAPPPAGPAVSAAPVLAPTVPLQPPAPPIATPAAVPPAPPPASAVALVQEAPAEHVEPAPSPVSQLLGQFDD